MALKHFFYFVKLPKPRLSFNSKSSATFMKFIQIYITIKKLYNVKKNESVKHNNFF